METTETFDENTISGKEIAVHPRSWQCTKLSDVRRRLIDLVKRIEKDGPTKCDRERVNYYRLLVYAYQTLAAVVKDSELDKLTARLDILEKRLPNEA